MVKKRNNRFDRGLAGKGSTYVRELDGFMGLDSASEISRVALRRVTRCVNMWRDYESENGGAIETAPGWRRIMGSEAGRVNGIFFFRGTNGTEYAVVHVGKKLYRIPVSMLDKLSSLSGYAVGGDVADSPSAFFASGGYLYILDGNEYQRLGATGGLHAVAESAYVPVTYVNGTPYQQRNMLTEKFTERYTVHMGEHKSFSSSSPWKYELTADALGLRIIGLLSDCSASALTCAHIPENAIYEGAEYPVMEFAPNVFDQLPYTEQLVVEAPLRFFGLSGSGVGGRQSGALSGMTSLQRVILRNPNAYFAFNACDSFVWDGGANAVPTAPLRELWIAGAEFGGYDASIEHEYSSASWGITSAYEGDVTLYVESKNEMWLSGSPTKTSTVNGVVFTEERTGGTISLNGVRSAEILSRGGATVDVSAAREVCSVEIDPFVAYSHIHLETDRCHYSILVRDSDTGLTCEENGKWLEYTVYEPFESIITVEIDGWALPSYEYKANAVAGRVAVLLHPSVDGGTLDIRARGYPSKFSTIENMATVYDNGLSDTIASWQAINNCSVVCAYDGRVFFTGNKALPNTVFFSGRGLNGENDPTYIGIYNYVNDGIGSVPNVAMVSSASMLAVFKGDISSDACAYYHVAKYNTEKATADLLPRIYPSTEGVSNIPCAGAACNFADDIVFLSPSGLEGVEKQAVNLERTLSHRSGRVDPILRKAISGKSRMVEWKGYLCILNADGTMLLADSRAINTNEATGEAQYEWFMLEGVGSYSDDMAKWVYGSGTVLLTDADGNKAELPLDGLNVMYGGEEYRVRIGVGETADSAEVISFGSVRDGNGKEYTVPDGLNAIMVDGCFCPVEESSERVGGSFCPATALCEFRGRLFFGAENGDVCVFNTDKRGVSYDEGELPGIISSEWYDRCGHRYESGFSTLSDDCGYPQFAKSTVGKTLTLRAKRMPDSAFTLAVRSEREDWRAVEKFTVTDPTFCRMDFANFSFEDSERGIFSSSEKLKRWGEKQLYFYSDGFRRPFGIYGLSYCYSFAGRLR